MVVKIFKIPFIGIQKQIKTKVEIFYKNKSILVDGLWDTGASGSCISYDVANILQLDVVGKIGVQTPKGEGIANKYIVDVKLPNQVEIKGVCVCDSEIGKQNIGMLIGMDIISKGDMAISNYNGTTIFSFRYPSCENIDFVKEARYKDLVKNNFHGKGKRKK